MEPTFLDRDVTTWTAVTGLATAALVLAALGGAAVAVRQLREVRNASRDEKRAYVSADFEQHASKPEIIEFVVRNSGATAARNVTFSWDPAPVRALRLGNSSFVDARIFEGIPTFAPGREIRLLFDSTHERFNANPPLPATYRLTIGYDDRYGRHHDDEFVLDAEIMRGSNHIRIKTIDEVAKALQDLASDFKQTVLGGRAISTESRLERAARERALMRSQGMLPGRNGPPPKMRG